MIRKIECVFEMVFLGASKGCKNQCKLIFKLVQLLSRLTCLCLCDEGKPICGRCKRSKRRCFGYDDPFRNQNQIVKHKANPSRQRHATLDRSSRPEDPDLDLISRDSLHIGLQQCPEQECLYFFINHYALLPQHEDFASGPTDTLPELFLNASVHSALSAATTALAMNRAAWYTGRDDYKVKSIAKYIEAIRKVNDDIQDQDHSNTDYLLQAVLVLGMWEVSFLPYAPAFC